MEYLALCGIMAVVGLAIALIYKRFTTKTYPQKTGDLLNQLEPLSSIGLTLNADRLQGNVQGYPVQVFATTSMKQYGALGGDNIHVMTGITLTGFNSHELKKIPSGFFVQGQTKDFAWILFIINAKRTNDLCKSVEDNLNELMQWLRQKNIEALKDV